MITALLIFISLLGFLCIVFIFGPLYLLISGNTIEEKKETTLNGWFIHRWIFSISFTYPSAFYTLIFFGKKKQIRLEKELPSSPLRQNSQTQSNSQPLSPEINSYKSTKATPLPSYKASKTKEPHFSNTTQTKSNEKPKSNTFRTKKRFSLSNTLSSLKALWYKLKTNPWVYLFTQTTLLKKLLFWLLRIIKASYYFLGIRTLTISIKSSFEDPADTAKWYGYIEALRYALKTSKKRTFSIVFIPCFSPVPLEISGKVDIKTALWKALWVIGVALTTFPYYRSIVTIITMKKLNKKNKQDIPE